MLATIWLPCAQLHRQHVPLHVQQWFGFLEYFPPVALGSFSSRLKSEVRFQRKFFSDAFFAVLFKSSKSANLSEFRVNSQCPSDFIVHRRKEATTYCVGGTHCIPLYLGGVPACYCVNFFGWLQDRSFMRCRFLPQERRSLSVWKPALLYTMLRLLTIRLSGSYTNATLANLLPWV